MPQAKLPRPLSRPALDTYPRLAQMLVCHLLEHRGARLATAVAHKSADPPYDVRVKRDLCRRHRVWHRHKHRDISVACHAAEAPDAHAHSATSPPTPRCTLQDWRGTNHPLARARHDNEKAPAGTWETRVWRSARPESKRYDFVELNAQRLFCTTEKQQYMRSSKITRHSFEPRNNKLSSTSLNISVRKCTINEALRPRFWEGNFPT